MCGLGSRIGGGPGRIGSGISGALAERHVTEASGWAAGLPLSRERGREDGLAVFMFVPDGVWSRLLSHMMEDCWALERGRDDKQPRGTPILSITSLQDVVCCQRYIMSDKRGSVRNLTTSRGHNLEERTYTCSIVAATLTLPNVFSTRAAKAA
jgi:hypothetical protein